MKNKPKSVRSSTKSDAASQPKTSQGRANNRRPSPSPSIVLFLEPDGSLSEEAIDLSVAEYATLKRAAAPGGSGVLMFMANAALEKAGWPPRNITCRFIGADGSELARVDFPSDVFARIEAAASKLGIILERFLNNAIRNFIRSQRTRRAS